MIVRDCTRKLPRAALKLLCVLWDGISVAKLHQKIAACGIETTNFAANTKKLNKIAPENCRVRH